MISALGTRHSALALAVFATLAACGADTKARADSVAAAARRDTVAADSARVAREDSVAAASVAKSSKTGAKTTGTKSNATKTGGTKILGRDSVRQGPIIGLPSIKDTAKPKPRPPL